jgi:hypothetical protein
VNRFGPGHDGAPGVENALRQKATGSKIQILGRVYGPRIVGLHNRFRARTDRYVRYLDFRTDRRLSHVPYDGLFVPGRERHRIFLRPGVSEMTVAHELMHGILYTEGFVGLRILREDLDRYPEMAALAGRLGDLLVHPVLLDRLRRSRFPVAREEIVRGARSVLQFAGPLDGAHDVGVEGGERASEPASVLHLFSRATLLAEALHRHPPFRPAIEELAIQSEPEALELGQGLRARAPWDPVRSSLRYRVRVGQLLGFLDDEARRRGTDLALRDRVLLSPFLTSKRLGQPAGRFFSVETRHEFPLQEPHSAVILRFRLDQTCSAVRLYARPEDAERARAHLARRIAETDSAEFLRATRIDTVILEPGGKARILAVDPQSVFYSSGS